MAQLIQMRQRIKAIETIKKITHAMRLISMSSHSRLRNKTPLLKKYNNSIEDIFKKLQLIAPNWQNPIINPQAQKECNALFILVGSQKGLCGTFNTGIIKEFEKTISTEQMKNINFITVGKKAVDYLADKKVKSIVRQFNEINIRNFTDISNTIIDIIINASTPYSCVKILSNELKTFFFQKPRLVQLIPIEKASQENKLSANNKSGDIPDNEYIWYQSAEEILDKLAPQYISSNINLFLFESLLSEQAARFLSMDSATRNAKKLLEETTLQYNKLRQAKITKELTELATNFE